MISHYHYWGSGAFTELAMPTSLYLGFQEKEYRSKLIST